MWSRTRNRLFGSEEFQGAMFQAMSFLDFNITPEQLKWWRSETLREHFTDRDPRDEQAEYPADFTSPLFVDSGGFKLMNARTFGESPGEGGSENEWGIYTNPKSILDLQLDYGADIIATLDHPIPPNLSDEEATRRMEQSVDNALECLRLLETREASPAVYVAIHGHDYETINWYVGQFLDRVSDLNVDFQGFAIGSLVPLREDTATLVDVVQGARDAIPDSRSEDLGLHVFGVGGRFCSLLALLGVDSFDSTTYARAAQYKKFIDPTNWQKIEAKDIPADWRCDCQACQNLDPEVMTEVLYDDRSYESINGYMKSDFYAIIAYHNFLVYQRELDAVRSRIDEGDGALLDYVAELATDEIDGIRKGLKRAQRRDSELAKHLRNRGFDHLVPHRQQTLNTGVPVVEDTERTISLDLSPTDFDIRRRDDYEPPDEESVLLVIPCSQQKPYSQSRTHRVVQDALSQYWNKVHKVTLSGLFGPVPEAYEEAGPVKSYEYVLTGADTDQQQVVINRLSSYLDRYGDRFEVIIGYATNKTYRHVISSAFDRYENDTVLLPADPPVLQLTEYFRGEHIDELRETVASSVSADDTQQRTL